VGKRIQLPSGTATQKGKKSARGWSKRKGSHAAPGKKTQSKKRRGGVKKTAAPSQGARFAKIPCLTCRAQQAEKRKKVVKKKGLPRCRN